LKFLRILECLNYWDLIQINAKEIRKEYCSLFGPPLAGPKPAGLVAHLKSMGAADAHGAQGGADDCPVALATPVARTSEEAD
jgi:hypothetical protein